MILHVQKPCYKVCDYIKKASSKKNSLLKFK